MIELFKDNNIRTSLFLDPDEKLIIGAKEIGTDRIELYTESYASNFSKDPAKAIKSLRFYFPVI